MDKRRQYSKEFKTETVRLVSERGGSVAQAPKNLMYTTKSRVNEYMSYPNMINMPSNGTAIIHSIITSPAMKIATNQL
jgi:hypothetical protein